MDIEEELKKINKYIELVLDKNYCDCNELNVICGKHCDGSKNVAYAVKKLLAEREEDKKRIAELKEYIFIAPNLDEMTAAKYISIRRDAYIRERKDEQQKVEEIINKNYIPKQKVINSINYYDQRIKHAKLIKDKEQEEFYIDIKRAFYKLLEDK